MDEQIKLSSCEILHIIGTLGKEDSFGIEDGFANMDEAEIKATILSVEDSLMEKGYAELNFDGNFSIAKKIGDILSVCSECDKYLDIQLNGINKQEIKKSVYCKGEYIVEFDAESSGVYLITYSNVSAIKEQIFKNLNWINDKGSISGKLFFTHKVLTSAKGKVGFGTEDELVKECNNRNAAKVIANGLNGNSNYYSFTLFDFTGEEFAINSLMILNSIDGSLEMEPEDFEKAGSMAFKPVDYKTVEYRISETLNKLQCKEATE